jgi:hypothetical protein
MQIQSSLDFTTIAPSQRALDTFVLMLRKIYVNLASAFNGNIGFGDGTLTDNLNGAWASPVTPGAVNTDFTVTHNLGRIPVGYLVMSKSAACDVYTGSVGATKTQLTLRATVAGVTLKLFIV